MPWSAVSSGRLAGWDSKSEHVAGATAAGVLSTVSNGFLLILTAPLWIITGSAAAASQSRLPIRRLPPEDWTELRAWARFPQGLPLHVDMHRLTRRH